MPLNGWDSSHISELGKLNRNKNFGRAGRSNVRSNTLRLSMATGHVGNYASCNNVLGEHPRTGPDGFRTLCDNCGRRYGNMRLPLYLDGGGRVTATATPRRDLLHVFHTGFKRLHGYRNMLLPRTLLVTPNLFGSFMESHKCFRCRVATNDYWHSPSDTRRVLCSTCVEEDREALNRD